MTPWPHVPVLLTEAVGLLVTQPHGVYVDGTYGRGGHARAILQRLSSAGRLIAFDKDPQAVAAATQGPQAITDERFEIVHTSFASMRQAMAARGIARVQGLLLDLGVSSPQLDDAQRGFSFRADAPLDMRMDTSRGETAADFLARADERDISRVIRDHGEERFAVPIAKALVARRAGGRPVRRTGELAEVVARAVRTREPGQDPATRTFQALRLSRPENRRNPSGYHIAHQCARTGAGDHAAPDAYRIAGFRCDGDCDYPWLPNIPAGAPVC